MEAVMREYYDGCNEADREKIMGCFTPDAAHYFPPGMYEGPFLGAEKIAERWRQAVEKFGSWWTIDAVLIDADKAEAVIEWTHFKTYQGDRITRCGMGRLRQGNRLDAGDQGLLCLPAGNGPRAS